jgi:ribonuclease R
MVHRILLSCLEKNIKVENKLEDWCKHCSDRERAAMECERAGNKYKQVEFMKQYIGEEFDGVISGVSGFGFWVETVEHKCEGLISIRDLSEYDDFQHDETDYALIGINTKKKFRMGDKIKIRVVAANLTKRQLDYEWVVEGSLSVKKAKSKRK